MPKIMIPTLLNGADPGAALAVTALSPVTFVRTGDRASLAAALREGIPAGYVAGPRLDHELRGVVGRILLAVPDAHVVVGLEDAAHPRSVPPIVSERVVKVAPLPAEAALGRAVVTVWFEGRVAALRQRIELQTWHWLLRRAVLATIAGRPGPDVHDHEMATVIRSLPHAADRCGAGEGTLRRQARLYRVELSAFIAVFKAALAVKERYAGTRGHLTPWPKIARRCGYADESGLAKLLKRELNASITEIGFGHLHALMDRLDVFLDAAR